MKAIFMVAMAASLCFLWIACGHDKMNPTATDLKATTGMIASSASSPSSSKQLTQAQGQGQEHHVNATLVPVNGSGVSGLVNITALPDGGVNINVSATGLTPGVDYLSLYYDNHTCQLEPHAEDDVIGNYTGEDDGTGHAQNKLEDDLDEVNSISVRLASDFTLLSCADIHP